MATGGEIVETLRTLRKQKGLTMAALADIVGCTESAISRWERGEREPDVSMLRKLASALDCTTDYLLVGKESFSLDDFAGMPPEQIAEFFASLPGFPKLGSHPDYPPNAPVLPEDERSLLSFYRDLNPQGKEVLRNIAHSMATSGIYARTSSSSDVG